MTPVILTTATLATLILTIQPARALALAVTIAPFHVVLAIVGLGVQLLGLSLSGLCAHTLVSAGMVLLVMSATAVRRWPGGWFLLWGVSLNTLAIIVHGRMPITSDVLAALGMTGTPSTMLPHSKDIVADGFIARWLGDRLIMALPFTGTTIVWSAGDILMLSGIVRAAGMYRA